MSYLDLRAFIQDLEAEGDLVRVTEEVDPNQEITIIQHRVLPQGGPALLFENVKGSPYRVVTNLFGTLRRVHKVFGTHPKEMGERIHGLSDRLMPPSLGNVWAARKDLLSLTRARLRTVRRGPILENEIVPPKLNRLPCLTCWPEDGGAFFTLPLVHTCDPENGKGNLGIYRLQRFDDSSTGMHWQIEKGGAFHFKKACRLSRSLPISVMLGGPPALTIAAVAPLPEGIDERLLASLMIGGPLDVLERKTTGHRIAATAEFVLEGRVSQGDVRREGPFGDHLGHYSHSADFPVFRVERMLARNDAIYPATVVGKPPQEDYFIGVALQEMTLPLLKLIRPGVVDLWAYPESGFHPLAVMSVRERYAREGLKHALGILGEGQMSLTKVLIVVGENVDVQDFEAVSRAIYKNLDAAEGLHLLAPTAQDTLDFTGPAMNSGSRLILLAGESAAGPKRVEAPPTPPKPSDVDTDISGISRLGEAFLMVQVRKEANKERVIEALRRHPAAKQYLFHILVSPDVPLGDTMLALWGWFTRFDPLADLHPASRTVDQNRLIFGFPIAIDATWKEGYRKPVEFDPDVEKRVALKWDKLGIPLDGGAKR